MVTFSTQLDVPLRGDVDIAGLIDKCPLEHAIKGLFVAPLVSRCGTQWREVEATLEAPPRLGRFVPFSDYPLRDYLRIMDAAARKSFPDVSGREAHRRISRSVFETFVDSTFGKVTAPLLGDPMTALSHYCRIYSTMMRGSTAVLAPAGPGADCACLQFRSYYSTVEAVVGVPEGVLMAVGVEPTVRVEVLGKGAIDAEVRWAPTKSARNPAGQPPVLPFRRPFRR